MAITKQYLCCSDRFSVICSYISQESEVKDAPFQCTYNPVTALQQNILAEDDDDL